MNLFCPVAAFFHANDKSIGLNKPFKRTILGHRIPRLIELNNPNISVYNMLSFITQLYYKSYVFLLKESSCQLPWTRPINLHLNEVITDVLGHSGESYVL